MAAPSGAGWRPPGRGARPAILLEDRWAADGRTLSSRRATFGGKAFDVWRTNDGSYLAFVPTTPMTSGTLDLLAMFNWTIGKGWLRASSTIGQICYGVEIVSTDGKDATWSFEDFSITES